MVNKKSQSATEFLLTYGWAIILVLVAAVGLAYIGALDSLEYFRGNKCSIYGNYYCADLKVDGVNQKVVLAVRNVMGLDVKDVTAKINTVDCMVPATGAVHAKNNIVITGDDNTINGGVLYGTTFDTSGSGNIFSPAPQQYTGSFPQPFSIEDYRPGGSAAAEAQAAGKYTQVTGDYTVSPEGEVLDGLYYVTGNTRLNGDSISGTYTIVSEGQIRISGDNVIGESYIDELILFSNSIGDEANGAIRLSGDESSFDGYLYAPNGLIKLTGSNHDIVGGLLGLNITIPGDGSGLELTYAALDTSFLKIKGAIPNPWINGQTVLLNFTCLGALSGKFKGTLEMKWSTEKGKRNINIGIVEGKTEY